MIMAGISGMSIMWNDYLKLAVTNPWLVAPIIVLLFVIGGPAVTALHRMWKRQ